ncbi:MAG: sigma-70 family RNA polymerase sigma factor [Propionibacteriales bacterium]|nr:sigma-70 family RNA polymerase sigma factor [Propionibacteriales bacterium]
MLHAEGPGPEPQSAAEQEAAYDEEVAALFGRFMPMMLAYARHLGAGNEAEDIALEAFGRVWRTRLKDGHSGVPPGSYFRTAVRNGLIDRIRMRRPEDVLDETSRQVKDIEFDDQVIDQHLIREAFKALSSRDREVLWWSVVVGLPLAEVATKLGFLTTGATSVLAHRARKRLLRHYLSLGGASEE